MNSPQNPDILRRRDEILQEMAKIDRMQRGTLSEQFFKTKKAGREVIHGPYYVLQQWMNGKHCSQRVPAKEILPVRGAIEGRERFEKLAQEFIEITERLTRERDGDPEAKKNGIASTKSLRRHGRRCLEAGHGARKQKSKSPTSRRIATECSTPHSGRRATLSAQASWNQAAEPWSDSDSKNRECIGRAPARKTCSPSAPLS